MARLPPRHPRPHPSVIDAPLANGDVVLVHLESQRSYSLNPTGAFVWTLVRQGLAPADITRAVADRFDAVPSVAAADVHGLLAELLDEGLLDADAG